MKEYTVKFKLKKTVEALERVLRITRQRCFLVNNLDVKNNDEYYSITMEVQSNRHINLLNNQLAKVVGLELL